MKHDEALEYELLKYKAALNVLETNIRVLIEEYQFKNRYNPVEHIKSRIKSMSSACDKLNSRGYELTLDNLRNHVHDMVGIRIVCSFLSDVREIVEIIKNSGILRVKEERDYITNPKDTGYISYHMIVYVPVHLDGRDEYIQAEIQIRTVAMDFWASLDHKIQYKFPNDIPEEIKKELYNCSVVTKLLDNKMQALNEIVNKYKD